MRFIVPASLAAQLRAVQKQRGSTDDVIEREDAFLLDPGLGPAFYLTLDGRVLVDYRDWDGGPIREATSDQACLALVVGAKKTGVTDLLALLPAPPLDSRVCPACRGEHWIELLEDARTKQVQRFTCPKCSGRGWLNNGAKA